MSYDIKFRLRALAYWNDGHSKKETAKVFKVSHFTLQKWKSQLKETGKLEAKKRRQTWRKIEPVRLVEYKVVAKISGRKFKRTNIVAGIFT